MKGEVFSMNSNSPKPGVRLAHEEGQVWDQFANDHELLERLRVTPQELTALKNCVLLGTLTCKDDMLFILRQIRLATDPSPGDAMVEPTPLPRRDSRAQDPAKEISAPANHRPTASVRNKPEPGSLGAISRSRAMEQFGVLCWTLIIVGLVMWSAVTGASSWRRHILSAMGIEAHQPAARSR
jgi:hypothetical protein